MSFKYTDNGKTTKSVGWSTTPQKVWDTLFLYRQSMLYIPFQQNAYKVPETKREDRRRTPILLLHQSIYKISSPLPINRTRRKYRRRRRRADGVLPVRRGPPDEVHGALSTF